MNGNKRQYILLGVLVLVVLAYFRFSGEDSGDVIGAPTPVDVAGLAASLSDINTVEGRLIAPREDSVPDRNLFKYGVKPPPPPDPKELERQRLAAEQALMRQEERARALREQQERQRQQQAAAAAKETVTPPPKKDPVAQGPKIPPPPNIDFKFMGIVGSAQRRIGVFLNGENLMLARKGGVLEEKFKVLDIGVAWADIGYVDPIHQDKSKRVYFGL